MDKYDQGRKLVRCIYKSVRERLAGTTSRGPLTFGGGNLKHCLKVARACEQKHYLPAGHRVHFAHHGCACAHQAHAQSVYAQRCGDYDLCFSYTRDMLVREGDEERQGRYKISGINLSRGCYIPRCNLHALYIHTPGERDRKLDLT